ncbi:alanine--glyoxylate aminotransferase family protein [Candidatus Micrarchaeota archaeon]|nr:alanine--glyoxylate aminotransferase family protein [Candidatus Micrarchaeota archaeon]
MLLTPGPVAVPQEIRDAQAKEMIYHRGPEMKELLKDVATKLKADFNAENFYIVTGSGTAGIEMCVANCVKPQENVLVLSNGTFGDKLANCAEIYGKVQKVSQPLGKGWSLERAKEAIDNSNATVLAMVYNETSTGVLNDAKGICNYAKKKGMLTIVDAVSAWAAAPLDCREFGIDAVASGSQKAIGCPPGLSFVAMGNEAVEKAQSHAARTFYLDVRKYKKEMETFQTPTTPAVSLLYAVQAALGVIEKKGGFAAHRKRHEEGAAYSREFVKSLEREVFAQSGFYSPTITGFILENADEVRKTLKEKYGLVTARDFGELRGRFFRVCHIGHFTKEELDVAFGYIREVLGK